MKRILLVVALLLGMALVTACPDTPIEAALDDIIEHYQVEEE
jgi:hypothetical protein